MKLYSPQWTTSSGATVQRGNHSNACSRFETLWHTWVAPRVEPAGKTEPEVLCSESCSIGDDSAPFWPTLPAVDGRARKILIAR